MSATSPTRPGTQNERRSNSLVGNFIKRTRSSDLLGDRNTSNTNLSRTKLNEGEEADQSNLQNAPPKLPSFALQPQIQTFGGETYVSSMERPSAHSQTTGPETPVLHSRAQSMTHRGRDSYAVSTISSVNSPRRVKRRKDPTSYNVLVIGQKNCGKTSFLKFLRSSIAPDADQENVRNPELDLPSPSAKSNPGTFIQHYQELEIENERIGLSLWDSQGFEKNIIDFQLRAMSDFVESKFEDTFIEEMKVVRSPGYRDTHIHCVFFLFDPAQLDMNIRAAKEAVNDNMSSIRKPPQIVGALDEDFELQILKNLQGKTTVIPVISKADTVTTARMEVLKRMVGQSFQQAGLDPLEALHFEQSDDEDDTLDEVDETAESDQTTSQTQPSESQSVAHENGDEVVETPTAATETESSERETTPELPADMKQPPTRKRETSKLSVSSVMFDNGYMPLSILSPDEHSLDGTDGPVGRRFPWGFADPYNPQHSDFVKLKETCFTEWRADFKEASREVFYERWRTGRLNQGPTNGVKKPTVTARKSSGGIPIQLTSRGKKWT